MRTAKLPNLIPSQIFQLYGIQIYLALNFPLIQEGWTALMDASFRDHLEVVKELLNNGANPDIKNIVCYNLRFPINKRQPVLIVYNCVQNGETALRIAHTCQHFDVVEVLEPSTSEVTTTSTVAQSDPKFKEHNVMNSHSLYGSLHVLCSLCFPL